jgi:hypothetical protein
VPRMRLVALISPWGLRALENSSALGVKAHYRPIMVVQSLKRVAIGIKSADFGGESTVAVPSGVCAVEVIVHQLVAYFWDKQDFLFLLRDYALAPAYR